LQPDFDLAFWGCFCAMALQPIIEITINKKNVIRQNFIIQKYSYGIINRQFEVKLQNQ